MSRPAVGLNLAEKLRACPSRDQRLTEKALRETWASLRQVNLEHGDAVTPALLLGVILHDSEIFAPLLNVADLAQLEALGKTALERYLQLTHPPNKLGKTIAAALKEQT